LINHLCHTGYSSSLTPFLQKEWSAYALLLKSLGSKDPGNGYSFRLSVRRAEISAVIARFITGAEVPLN
jgi:hypothetical protein